MKTRAPVGGSVCPLLGGRGAVDDREMDRLGPSASDVPGCRPPRWTAALLDPGAPAGVDTAPPPVPRRTIRENVREAGGHGFHADNTVSRKLQEPVCFRE